MIVIVGKVLDDDGHRQINHENARYCAHTAEDHAERCLWRVVSEPDCCQ